jgi:predicted enzyme related to lactoylglutathione lyase
MFLGLRTVIYRVPELARARDWYAEAFGVRPYFDQPYYVGFEVGGYELGLQPGTEGVRIGDNAVAYWGVADIGAAHAALLAKGAGAADPIADVGGDIKVATVTDPFGNVIGIIENPHFTAGPSDAGARSHTG